MLHSLIALLGLLLPLSLYAHQGANGVSAWANESQNRMEAYLGEANQLKERAETEVLEFIEEKKLEEQSCCQQVETKHEDEPESKTKAQPSILIFVSLSMPNESLKNLYKEAERQGFPLLMRGLKNNSFKETAQVFNELEIAAQIDPQLFEEYSIKAVPSFVRIDQKEPLQIQGNISLDYAQKKFEEAL